MGFEPAWLAARRPYDEAALDRDAIAAIQAWGHTLPDGYQPVVVDLGSGTGAALARVRRWLAPRPLRAYAVDRDAALLAHQRGTGAVPLVADLLGPLDHLGGPADGAVDLVVGHALADLLPLDHLANRVAALVRSGGLIHLALVYDGLTAFMPTDDPDLDVDTVLEAEVIGAFHRHMDRPAAQMPEYGGSTAGRRLGPALAAAGLEIVADAPSIWTVRADDGPAAHAVLARLLHYVADAAREVRGVASADLDRWEVSRRAALARRTLAAQVAHRDLLARRPG